MNTLEYPVEEEEEEAEEEKDEVRLGILKQFTFSSELQVSGTVYMYYVYMCV